MRLLAIATLVAATMAVGVPNAQAAFGDQVHVGWTGSVLQIRDNSGLGVANDMIVFVDPTAKTIEVHENSGTTIVEEPLSDECASAGATHIVCTFPTLPPDLVVDANLAGGDDTISGSPRMRFLPLLLGDGNDTVPNAGGGNDTIRGGAGNDTIHGIAGADHLFGDEGADTLQGDSDDDTYDGGPGADTFNERSTDGGNDTINAQDGEADAFIDCGPGTGDVANVDAIDPAANNCEGPTGGGAGGGGDPPAPYTAANAPGLPGGTTYTVPKLEPRLVKKRKSTKWKLAKVSQLKEDVADSKAHVKLVGRRLNYRAVPDDLKDVVQHGNLITLDPKPGAKLEGTANAPGQLKVAYYDETRDLNRQKCPYKKTQKLKVPGTDETLTQFLRGQTAAEAARVLKRLKCTWVVKRYVRERNATEHTIASASITSTRTKTKRSYKVNLVISRPERPDFAIEVGPRPAQDWTDNPGNQADFAEEMAPDDTDRLTTSSGNQLDYSVLTVLPLVNSTGMPVRKARVELYDATGKLLNTTETGNAGAVTFTAAFFVPGTAFVKVIVAGDNGVVMEGWRNLEVVNRARKPWMTADKRRFVYSRDVDGYVPAKDLPADPICVRQADEMATVLRDLASGLPSATKIVDHLNAASAGEKCLALQEVFRTYGVAPAQLVNDNGKPVKVQPSGNTGTAAVVQNVPTLVGRGNGTYLNGRFPAAAIAPGAAIAGVSIPAHLIGNDAGSLVGADGATLLGLPGGVLLGADIAKLIAGDAGSLVGPDGASLIGNNGNTIRFSLADLVGDAGSGIRPPTATGAGIASTLAGPALLPPGGGFAVPNIAQTIADIRAGGIISDNGGGIISDNGGGLISDRGAGLLPGISFGGVSG
jgi:Ca2+-binding RTX toxin-like protein